MEGLIRQDLNGRTHTTGFNWKDSHGRRLRRQDSTAWTYVFQQLYLQALVHVLPDDDAHLLVQWPTPLPPPPCAPDPPPPPNKKTLSLTQHPDPYDQPTQSLLSPCLMRVITDVTWGWGGGRGRGRETCKWPVMVEGGGEGWGEPPGTLTNTQRMA
jgi:hypothetical protein